MTKIRKLRKTVNKEEVKIFQKKLPNIKKILNKERNNNKIINKWKLKSKKNQTNFQKWKE